MERETFIITIDGEEVSDLYENLIRLEVEVDEKLAAMFRLQIGIALQPDGTWTFLDDERFRVWQPYLECRGVISPVECDILSAANFAIGAGRFDCSAWRDERQVLTKLAHLAGQEAVDNEQIVAVAKPWRHRWVSAGDIALTAENGDQRCGSETEHASPPGGLYIC